MDYRNKARKLLERARENFNTGDDYDLIYSALDLRMTLECLIYEKAQNYKGELSLKVLSTWQPRKLLTLLLEIDPDVDKDCGLSAGIEEEYGKPSNDMKFIGTETVLSLSNIKKYYDRLGSYLHSPTIEQVEQKKIASPEKIRARCKELIDIVNTVLSSPIFNFNMSRKMDWSCEKCGNKITRRIPSGVKSFSAGCIDCNATYFIESSDDLNFSRKSKTNKVPCASPSCEGHTELWVNDIVLGSQWKCLTCGVTNQFSLGIGMVNSE